ncbi:DegT/DnrJ/EryC1/StrS family aminotransferase [Aporhodopirellula aestuarii]|uniref:DegT/DnrJ/EryC1/StrS family aminotransferase n=1 Tax=Aporhodopirellula aestuarii TaxID=2950107 RepID=A0ABT0UBR4_9BACT|nr:DegT/DnrJ/EryC1/StrS family aminotransferase [Aporhodopirellula aestuarii]MCM2374358.1 DegT/DnrJ/EryC1/StrS family aminotransferase [Aporhodopirellula aestuarii]
MAHQDQAPSGVPLLDVNRDNAPHREEFIEALTEVLDSGRFLFGPDVTELETELAGYCQVPNVVGCASGSDALLLALMALNIGPGDEVIVPSFTFFASVSCITRLGATPVFADICPGTFNIDPESIESLITDQTKAIIPVHLFGQCAEIDRICQIASGHDIPVVEDAAQAIGAAYNSRPAGSWGTVGCFSFYPTKNLGGMGDGGMMTSCDAAFADRLRLFAGHGMRPRYYHQVVGINSRLDTFQAAVLRVKLRHLGDAIENRSTIADRYDRLLTESGLVDNGEITLPVRDSNAFHVWNQYAIRVENGRRDELRSYLAERKVGSEIYYPIPMHQQQCFEGMDFRHNGLAETEKASLEVLNLPIFPSLTEAEQCRVIEVIGSFYAVAAKAAA